MTRSTLTSSFVFAAVVAIAAAGGCSSSTTGGHDAGGGSGGSGGSGPGSGGAGGNAGGTTGTGGTAGTGTPGSGGSGGTAGTGGTGGNAAGAGGTAGAGNGGRGGTAGGGTAGNGGRGGNAGNGTGSGGTAGNGTGNGGRGGNNGTGNGGRGGGAGGTGGIAATLTLTSTAFTEGTMIPAAQTCTAGSHMSPPLTWTAGPSGTMSYGIALVDMTNGFVHWTIWDMPSTTTALPGNLPKTQMLTTPIMGQQHNRFGSDGYFGPCPSGQTHTYVFEVYALDVAKLPSVSATSATLDIRTAMMTHSLATGTLSGTSNASM